MDIVLQTQGVAVDGKLAHMAILKAGTLSACAAWVRCCGWDQRTPCSRLATARAAHSAASGLSDGRFGHSRTSATHRAARSARRMKTSIDGPKDRTLSARRWRWVFMIHRLRRTETSRDSLRDDESRNSAVEYSACVLLSMQTALGDTQAVGQRLGEVWLT